MPELFRCVACGAASATATRCAACGGGAFELARPSVSRHKADSHQAELVSLQAARDERARRQRPDARDGRARARERRSLLTVSDNFPQPKFDVQEEDIDER